VTRSVAVVPVRDGVLAVGGDEAVAECDGRALLVGSGCTVAARELAATEVKVLELDDFAPGSWGVALAAHLTDVDVVVVPASPDGRDLAPRLAHALGRPLLAGAIEVRGDGASCARHGGLVIDDLVVDGPFVSTLQPGVRGVLSASMPAPPVEIIEGDASTRTADAEVIEVLAPDLATIDLSEAPRIVAGGAGLDGPSRFDQLARIASALDASVGATRVVTDRGWVGHVRQIGTTGVVVDPELYIAFGISGAVQHTSGLGTPDYIVSVNTDAHCPMMQLADLAIVCDANAVLDALEERLGG
jgi:electron transfer flavoprotein alpha subunit